MKLAFTLVLSLFAAEERPVTELGDELVPQAAPINWL